ncbi:uncharacterized protein BDZ99DRAFT_497572 [Mytilinidion resinicola]|uniref:Heterokaryon incompatibility domain-containing protein n=1 Tax=Mytilinidion resinicola TaxID=574789 RepID=A0A6A6YVF8_9PEZI|nr:uncharacterized protein BDZ99DRAFT_497572 [Mytilinidion resinicola]KAF2811965.1 hypothetical protein BDZ99DRAFT_497572 [Mytilinidion resinicola]
MNLACLTNLSRTSPRSLLPFHNHPKTEQFPHSKMEHLNLPNNADDRIKIPYYRPVGGVSYSYDGLDFRTYPQRCGWDLSAWSSITAETNDFSFSSWLATSNPTQSLENLGSFLQTWLFFGLLSHVTRLDIKTADFLRRDEYGDVSITTAALQKYQESWVAHPNEEKSEDEERDDLERMRSLRDAEIILRQIENVISAALEGTLEDPVVWKPESVLLRLRARGSVELTPEERGRSKTMSAVLADIHFSCCLLVAALSVTSGEVSWQYTGVFPLLHLRMIEDGWCPFYIRRAWHNLAIENQVRAFALGSIRCKLDHSDCHRSKCVQDQAGSAHEPAHCVVGCKCALIQPPIEEMIEILKNGDIPVLLLSEDEDDDTVSEMRVQVHAAKDFPYIAISHVWADGLGNPKENAIPECQARRLHQHLLSYMREREESEDTLYFAETLPFWLDTLCIPIAPEYKELRNASIVQMHQIYRDAEATLILDQDLENLPPSEANVNVLVRLAMSAWSTRLWTYQEGATARGLYIAGDGRSIHIDMLVDLYMNKQRLQREFKDLLQIFRFRIAENRMLARSNDYDDWQAQCMLRALFQRTTSRGDDEAICIGSFLAFDISTVLEAEPGDRMKALLSLFPTIPPNIIFGFGERIAEKGFRWAPKTFLYPDGLAFYPLPPEMLRDYASVQGPGSSSVENGAIDFATYKRAESYLHPEGLGLVTFFPSIRLIGGESLTQHFVLRIESTMDSFSGR